MAFRYSFHSEKAQEVRIRSLGASWYTVHLDGEYFDDGPYRFTPEHPQYGEVRVKLTKGRHVLAAEVRNDGAATRMLCNMPPFFGLEVWGDSGEIPLTVKALRLEGVKLLRRINPQLGWSEERRLEGIPDFCDPDFCDAEWAVPQEVFPAIGAPEKIDSAKIRRDAVRADCFVSGFLSENFGYDGDDPPVSFFLRKTEKHENVVDGVWFRYDLGRIRLCSFEAVVDAPRGAVMEIAYSETLSDGRVSPWITLSAGASCNMDRYRLREGINRISGFVPHGGRYAEIHLRGITDARALREITFYERNYFGEPTGAFECGDAVLNRIWRIGADTFRACCEDTVTDNPTRERGEWTGDTVGAGLEICAAAYDDMRIIGQGLRHAAWCASADGCVAGLCPGGVEYLSTYALQWVCACLKYFCATGDRALLESLYPYAERNMDYFAAHWQADGLDAKLYWAFVDWGYVPNAGSDMAVNLFYHSALRDYIRWAELVGRHDAARAADMRLQQVHAVIAQYLAENKGAWETIGMHCAALSLGEGFFRGEEEQACVAYIKRHYLDCFPNCVSAPRLSSPEKNNPRLITPYFSHYVFPLLWERGEGDFVLGQYRTCWGWLMERDNTWLEVFDDRWSHCHTWSGCPTWQLTRYVTGLRPRFDIRPYCYEVSRKPSALAESTGTVPVCGGGSITVTHSGTASAYTADKAVWIIKDGVEHKLLPGKTLHL